MAENKKSILVYADWINKFEELTDDEAGKLIKHFFRYVNDLNPEAPDRTTKLLFIDIQNSLKRDLEKWENKIDERSINGRLGNLKRYNSDIYEKVKSNLLTLEEGEDLAKSRKTSLSDISDRKTSQPLANVAVNVSVSDSVINNIMTETQFIEYWKKCRMEYDKKITNIDKLEFHERQIFDRIKSEYTIERITDAVAGMFMQRNMFPALRLRPKHFLESFTKYLDCWDNDIQLFKDDKKDNFKQDKL